MNNKNRRGIPALTAFILISLLAVVFSRASGLSQTGALMLDPLRRAQISGTSAVGAIVLTDEQAQYPLGMHMAILEDPGGKLTIDQVSSPANAAQFVPSQSESPNYGFTDSAYWVRLDLENETRQTHDWLLELNFANMQYVDLYTRLRDGGNFTVRQTGTLRPLSTRDVVYPHIIFALSIPTQSQQTYYLRFKSGASMTLPLTLWAKDSFWIHAQWEQMRKWLFYGAILALLVYHLFLLYSLREATYLYFVLLLASIFVVAFTYDGYMGVYLFPNLYAMPSFLQVSLALLLSCIVLFSDAFLDLRNRLPKFRPVRIGLIASCGVMILLSLFTSYGTMIRLLAIWGVISITLLGVAGAAIWKKGFSPAAFLMLAWLGMGASVILVLLVRLGIVLSSIFSENMFYVGLVWMALCWAIALADRINRLKAETEGAYRGIRSSERRLSQILEGMPLGVVLYGMDHKPSYINQRTVELLGNPAQELQPDVSAGRTLAQAIQDFSVKPAGSTENYPLESFPVFSALQGTPASADDIEMDQGDKRVALEMWANPVRDETGNVESAVVAFQDITRRKESEAELSEYRKRLESLVEKRTAELNASNKELRLRLEWMSAIVLVTEVMARSSGSSQSYEKIIEIINRLFAIQGSFVTELDESRNALKLLAHSGRSENQPELIGSFTTFPGDILARSIQEPGELIVLSKDELDSISGPMGIHLQAAKIQGLVLVPLLLREKVFGFLGMELPGEGRTITGEESNLLRIFSIDIAQLIEDSRLFEQSRALITAEERNRLARDLHDSVTQVLYSASLIAELLPQRFRRDPEAAIDSAVELRRLTHGALAEMRTLLLELRPAGIVQLPLGELLTELIEAVASRSELNIKLAVDNVPLLPADVQISFYRIAQEALNNVVKHAQLCRVVLSLSATPPFGSQRFDHWDGEIKMVISDDGPGFSLADQGFEHLGLGIMRERAAAIGAIFGLESHPGQGTQVALTWHS